MGKKKDTVTRAIPTLKCSLCGTVVTADTYANHIQTMHSTPPTTTATFQPSGGWGGPQQQANVQPITGSISGKELAGGKYLKGEDVPDGTNEVRFRVLAFVRDPQGRSKLAAQISETYKKSMFGFNTTNIRALVGLGFEDLQTVVNRTLVCMLGMAPNPQQNGRPTKALFVTRVE